MTNRLEENYNLLQKEIYDITKNIHIVKNKSHKTMSKIVEKLKYIEKDMKPMEQNLESNENLLLFTKMNQTEYESNTDKNIKNPKLNNYLKTYNNNISFRFKQRIDNNTNYKKYQPVIHLYKNYKNNNKSNINFNSPPKKKCNNTIDNCITIAKEKFFLNNTKSNIKNEIKYNKLFFKDCFDVGEKHNKSNINNYKRGARIIDFNTNYNETIQTEGNSKYQKKMNLNGIINFNHNSKNNLFFHSKNILKDNIWNNECEKLNESINNKEKDTIKNNIFFGKYNNQKKNALYKQKINLFKEKSDFHYEKISSKYKINDSSQININKNKNIINKTFNNINNLKKNLYHNKKSNNNKFNNKNNHNNHNNYNHYNSFSNIEIQRIKKNNYFINKKFFSENKIIEKIKELLNCKNIEECLEKINEFSEQKKFVNKMLKIYNKYNNGEMNKGDNYENVLLWINYLIYSKQRNTNDDKYEFFCKQLMKENDIKDFSLFQSYARNIINGKKNANNFLEDIKKILSVEDCIYNEINCSKNVDKENENK